MPVDPLILDLVQSLVAEILGVDRAEAAPDAQFAADLGGESIDLLDLSFRCEKTLGGRVRFQDVMSQDLAVVDGALSAQSLELLQQRFPVVDVSQWRGRRFTRPLELLTVRDLAAIVEGQLRQTQATDCVLQGAPQRESD